MGVNAAVQATAFVAAACRTEVDPYAHLFTSGLTAAQRAMADAGRAEVVARTRIIDELLLSILSLRPMQTVVNLGAGLCTRPYRLDLSQCRELTEIDTQEIINTKAQILSGYQESCPVRRIPGDARALPPLDDPGVIVTEGLLVYLSAAELSELALTLPGRHWLADIVSAPSAQAMAARSNGLPLSGLDSLAVFESAGWAVTDYRPLPVARPYEVHSSRTVIDGVLHLVRTKA